MVLECNLPQSVRFLFHFIIRPFFLFWPMEHLNVIFSQLPQKIKTTKILNCRDMDLTEKLDYSSAILLLGYSIILAIIRSFGVRNDATRVMVAAPLLAFSTTHILFLCNYQMDYGIIFILIHYIFFLDIVSLTLKRIISSDSMNKTIIWTISSSLYLKPSLLRSSIFLSSPSYKLYPKYVNLKASVFENCRMEYESVHMHENGTARDLVDLGSHGSSSLSLEIVDCDLWGWPCFASTSLGLPSLSGISRCSCLKPSFCYPYYIYLVEFFQRWCWIQNNPSLEESTIVYDIVAPSFLKPHFRALKPHFW